jgi:hypothetical protein
MTPAERVGALDQIAAACRAGTGERLAVGVRLRPGWALVTLVAAVGVIGAALALALVGADGLCAWLRLALLLTYALGMPMLARAMVAAGGTGLFRQAIAEPGCVAVGGPTWALNTVEDRFTLENAVIVVERWSLGGVRVVRLLRSDGRSQRLYCSAEGFEHLIACWAAHARTDAEPDDV